MATEFCQRCKQSHPGRVCDYDDKGECAETLTDQDNGENKSKNELSPREPGPSSGVEKIQKP